MHTYVHTEVLTDLKIGYRILPAVVGSVVVVVVVVVVGAAVVVDPAVVVMGAGVVPPAQMWIRPMLASSAFLHLEKELRQEDLAVITFITNVIKLQMSTLCGHHLVKLVLGATIQQLGLLH